ncbi:MAG: DUF4139 domain-containing protein [Bacteroidales bacterium]|jgi:hypothetical protein|nr:DUF4139 domain-containing protein [Bacteroidales bacterium]
MSNLPLCRLALFSSGVGFFEHRGSVTGSAELSLPFHVDAINDALKSLVINDPAGSPVVSYPLEETLSRTLKSLSLDLRDSSVYDLLHNFRGAEIEILAPDSIRGRIIFVERRKEYVNSVNVNKDYLSLQTATGIKTICVDEISSFAFCDPQITADLNRALNLILQCRNNETRNIAIKLSGESERNVNLSYVIPTTLWKVSYRLDLSGEKPFLQGWAIIENDSDIDWENVELALVTGKPVSFIQKLYEIHKLSRPVIPLLIEGIAEAKMYDSGSANYSEKANKKTAAKFSELAMPGSMRSSDGFDALVCCEEAVGQFEEEDECDFAGGPKSGLVETADARAAGDQFEFKIKNSVNLARQQSAMLPLVEGEIKAEKILVLSKKRAIK